MQFKFILNLNFFLQYCTWKLISADVIGLTITSDINVGTLPWSVPIKMCDNSLYFSWTHGNKWKIMVIKWKTRIYIGVVGGHTKIWEVIDIGGDTFPRTIVIIRFINDLYTFINSKKNILFIKKCLSNLSKIFFFIVKLITDNYLLF